LHATTGSGSEENSLCDARSRFTPVSKFSRGELAASAKIQSRCKRPCTGPKIADWEKLNRIKKGSAKI
jgi:hypothetical protein